MDDHMRAIEALERKYPKLYLYSVDEVRMMEWDWLAGKSVGR